METCCQNQSIMPKFGQICVKKRMETIFTLNIRGRLLDLSVPRVMGIVNVTPDSFYDGGRHDTAAGAADHAARLLEEGADLLDIGAYSSRPGAADVSEQEELDRLIPVVERVARRFPDASISVDTFRASVAAAAVAAGAGLVNDISGGMLDPEMFATVARLDAPFILMHMRGTPATMQQLTDYPDMMAEICTYFGEKIQQLRRLGVKDIILDPGFGFAKTIDQNYELLRRLDELHMFGLPLLGALSRKSMIYKTLGVGAEQALNGTTVLHTVMLMKGLHILRVHDVKEAREAVTLTRKLVD